MFQELLGLKKREIDAIQFAFDVYDFQGDGTVDAFYAGDLLRACNLNPTLKTITKVGGEAQKGTKMLHLDEIYPMYQACKDSKDQGGFHDFVEILKLYDKMNENTMLGNDLFKILTNMGEKLSKVEAKELMNELCEPEDEDGFMPFLRKLPVLFHLMNLIFLFSFPDKNVRCRTVNLSPKLLSTKYPDVIVLGCFS